MKKLFSLSIALASAVLFAAETGNMPADSVDAAKLAIVQKSPTRVFVDFGNEVAVRSLSWKGEAKPKVYAKWWKNLGDEDPKVACDVGVYETKDGVTTFRFHTIPRQQYVLLDGAEVDAASVKYDVVPYGFTMHLTDETWEQKLKRMEWWTEARFGMFIHFGLYAAQGIHEWQKSNARISDSDYDRYFKNFNPDQFDAKKWAKAAKDAGMKYAVLTTRHHEGFSLFDTKFSNYKITNTAFGRDLVREFVEAFRAEGLKVGFYYSLLDWHHPDYTIDRYHPRRQELEDQTFEGNGSGPEAVNKNRDMAKYRAFMKNQITELLTNYGKIDILWYDFSFPGPNGKTRYDWDSEGILKLTKRLQPDIIIDNRLDLTDYEDGWDFATPEQNRESKPVTVNGREVPWETCQTFSGSWGYARDERSWKSVPQCLEQLIFTVANGGNVIMNVGPDGRGNFDYRALDRLVGYGKWLRANGESIYGCTRAPAEYKAPANTILTWNPQTRKLYMHVLFWQFGEMPLEFADKIDYAQLLNDKSEVEIKWGRLFLPVEKPPVEIPVIEFTMK